MAEKRKYHHNEIYHKCDKCGITIKTAHHVHYIQNNLALRWVTDTRHIVCTTCYNKLRRIITKQYNEYFKQEGEE